MIALTNTDIINASSSKEAKNSLYRLPFKRLNTPLKPSELLNQLQDTHTVIASTIPAQKNKLKALSNNADTNRYYVVNDCQPLSHFKALDIEPRVEEIQPWLVALDLPTQEEQEAYIAKAYPYLNVTPRQLLQDYTPMLTEEQVHSRLATLSNSYIHHYTASHNKPIPNTSQKELRLHSFLCMDKLVSASSVEDYINLQFPEYVVPNDHHIVRAYAIGRTPNLKTKPLYIDLVTYRHKQRMYMSPYPLELVGNDSILTERVMNSRLATAKQYNKSQPIVLNLVRADLVEAERNRVIKKHGSLSKAQEFYDLYGDNILEDTLLYDTNFKLMGEAGAVVNSPDFFGKNCNYGKGQYKNNASGYLQVAAGGGTLSDHRTQSIVQIIEKITEVFVDSKHLPTDIQYTHKIQANIAMTGSGKTYGFKNRPYTVLCVPQTKQVLAQKEGFTRVVSNETIILDDPSIYTSFSDAIDAGHTTFICTYDKLAGTYANDKVIFSEYTLVADEIHEFLTISATNRYGRTRDILFQAIRAKEFKTTVLMSATITPSILRDIVPAMPVTKYITQQVPAEVEIVFSLPYEPNKLFKRSPQYLRDIIRNDSRTVVYINNKSVGRGLIYEHPLGAKTLTGTSGNDPITVLATKPNLLVTTSAVKQGFSIDYPVDTYVVYLDYRGEDNYSLNEIEQITARCRDVKKIIIVMSPRRLDVQPSMNIPTQETALALAIDHADGKTNNEWEADMLKGYTPLLEGINTQTEDEAMPLFYISERRLLGNRMQLESLPKAYGLKHRNTVTINNRQAVVVQPPTGRYIPSHSMPKRMTELKKELRFNVHSWDDLERVIVEYAAPDDMVSPWLLSVEEQGTYNDLMQAYNNMTTELRAGKLKSDTALLLCLPMYEHMYKGWVKREELIDKRKILIGKNDIKAVSTIQRMWKGNEALAKKLGVKKHTDLTAIQTLDILEHKLHQQIEFVAENKAKHMELLIPTLWDGSDKQLKDYKYDNKYPLQQGSTLIGYTTTDGVLFKMKREKKGKSWMQGYPVGSKVILTNEEYIYES